MAAFELLLGVEHLLAGGAVGGTETTTTASGAEEDLLLAAILLCEVCALEGGVVVGLGELVQLELVDAARSGGEREDKEGEGGEEHGCCTESLGLRGSCLMNQPRSCHMPAHHSLPLLHERTSLPTRSPVRLFVSHQRRMSAHCTGCL